MKKHFLLLSFLLCVFISNSFGQQLMDTAKLHRALHDFPMQNLKPADMARLASLPELKMPEQYLHNKLPLPYMVDNSTQPYFRPIGMQQGYECGQSAGIAYNFTYELCRLKNISAQLLENQIVTHFSWDFLNNGQQYVGASAFDGYEIVRAAGSPDAVEYGGSLVYGGHTRWMSGYNLYYSAMHNRLNTAYQLNVSTEEGLAILKQWLYDHLEGSAVGGVVNFYGGYFGPSEVLPAGTEEGGKAVKTSWTGSSHTWTICGYNDSIKWDYNNDGQYTNTIDINGDGLINMRDWEIGGLKFANGYYGTSWGNNGFCYMMYKCLADQSGAGGLWNNSVFALGIKENCDPQLTYKVTVNHTCRNMLKLKAGIALNLAASKPEYYLDFPIFSYQGGPLYMQGDTTQAAKTLELGLDCTPLLSYINPGQSVKYFLDVYENDPSATNTGQIVNFSVIDYASGMNETACAASNVPIINNDTTRLSVQKSITFSKVGITTDTLALANVNEPYAFQLTAANGSAPYRWDVDWTAAESQAVASFPAVTAQQLVFQSSNNGYATQNLSFDFPYCGTIYDKVYVNPNGFIKFENGLYTWPFIIDKDLLFRQTRMIGVCVAELANLTVYYEGNANYATFRWSATISGQSGSNVNAAIKLYPSGKIEFYYGAINMNAGTHWLSGTSCGDNRNYQLTKASSAFSVNTTPYCITYTPAAFPQGLSLSEDGLLSGTTSDEMQYAPLQIRVTDNNNIWSTRNIPFSTQGILMEYTVLSGSDSIVQAGESAVLSIKLKNIGVQTVSNAVLYISEVDSLVLLTDSTESVGSILPGDSVMLTNAIAFDIAPSTEGGHIIHLDAAIVTPTDTFNNSIRLVVHTFMLEAGAVSVADGNNNILEAGENAALIIGLSNVGGATATDIHVHLSCADPYINITSADADIDSLVLNESSNMFFLVSASAALPNQRIIVFNLDITASNNYHNHDFVVLILGEMGETFETGDYTAYPWTLTGNTNWYIQDTTVYLGTYASKSGNIADNESSTMQLAANILADGDIRFVRKVSCEADATNHNYDYLAFFIDGVEKARWDGNLDWAEMVYPVTAGNHTFKWSYIKDYSVSTGLDAALLDNIIFPPIGDENPAMVIAPLSIYKEVYINSIDTSQLTLSNNGSGLVLYNSDVEYINNPTGEQWCRPEYFAGNVDAGTQINLNVLLDANGLNVGTYNSTLTISSNFVSEVQIPVTMDVIPLSSVDEYAVDHWLRAYPNPFQSATTIGFEHVGGAFKMEICDLQGRVIRTLVKENILASGNYSIVWDACNTSGASVTSGVYLCRMYSNDQVYCMRLMHID